MTTIADGTGGFGPDNFLVPVYGSTVPTVPAKWLVDPNGDYVIDPVTNKPYIVPADYNPTAAIQRGASIANLANQSADPSGALAILLYTDAHAGGPDDLQRSYNGSVDQTDVPLFKDAASYSYALVASAAGLTPTEVMQAGGAYNGIKQAANEVAQTFGFQLFNNLNTSGPYYNNPDNAKNISAGISAFQSQLYGPPPAITPPNGGNLSYNKEFSGSSATSIAQQVIPTALLTQNGMSDVPDPAIASATQEQNTQTLLVKVLEMYFPGAIASDQAIQITQTNNILTITSGSITVNLQLATADNPGQVVLTTSMPNGGSSIETLTLGFVPEVWASMNSNGFLTAVRTYDANGHLVETDVYTYTYNSDGSIATTNIQSFNGAGALIGTTVSITGGNTTQTIYNNPSDHNDNTIITSDSSGSVIKSVSTVSGSSAGSYITSTTDGAGNLISTVTVTPNGGSIVRSETDYGPGGGAAVDTVVTTSPIGGSGVTTVDVYDGDGNLQSHTVINNGTTVETTYNNPNDPNQTTVVTTAPDGTVLSTVTTTLASNGTYVTTGNAGGVTTVRLLTFSRSKSNLSKWNQGNHVARKSERWSRITKDSSLQKPGLFANSSRQACLICSIAADQSPGVDCRNSRVRTGYHGQSARSCIHRQSVCISGTNIQHGLPNEPARCAIAVSAQITRSSWSMTAALSAKSSISDPRCKSG
jgi:hypothetical protein